LRENKAKNQNSKQLTRFAARFAIANFLNKLPLNNKMELNILEETKNKLVFELKGEGHTLCAMLKKELWNDEHTKAAGYHIEHPLVGIPRFTVETDGAEPKKVVIAALKRLDKQLAKLKDSAKEVKA